MEFSGGGGTSPLLQAREARRRMERERRSWRTFITSIHVVARSVRCDEAIF